MKSPSRVQFFVTPWAVAYQAPLSMGFSRQEYWSALPFPSPGDLLDPGIKPRSPTLQADALLSESPGKCQTWREGERREVPTLFSDSIYFASYLPGKIQKAQKAIQ